MEVVRSSPKPHPDLNKALVASFYDLAFNQRRPGEAAAKFLAPNYRQHNPGAADGPSGFVEFVTAFTSRYPKARVIPKRAVAEGDLVAVHLHVQPDPEARGWAAIDIFRLEGGRIAEHWDVMQEIPERTANPNTMF